MIDPERGIIHSFHYFSNGFLELLNSLLNVNLKLLCSELDFLLNSFGFFIELLIEFEFKIKLDLVVFFRGVIMVFIHLKTVNQ